MAQMQVEKNIYQRGEYSFQVKMMVHGHSVSETFDDLNSAREFRDRKKLEAATDPQLKQTLETRISKSEAKTFLLGHALARYLKEVTPLKKGASTEEYKIKKLMRCKIAFKSFYSVTGNDLKEMFKELESLGAKTSGAQLKYGSIVSHLYNTARREWGLKVENPTSTIKMPAAGKARVRRYLKGEEKRVLRECYRSGNVWLALLARFAVETAARQSELIKLKWKNVNIEKRVALLLDTKIGDDRDIPLSPCAISLLKEAALLGMGGRYIKDTLNKRQIAEVENKLGMTVEDIRWTELPQTDEVKDIALSYITGQVFRTTASAIKQAFRRALTRARISYEKACARAGIEPDNGFLVDLRWHDLRHEATSRLFETGLFGDREVMAVTGHKTTSMLGRYTHLRAENLADKLAQADAAKAAKSNPKPDLNLKPQN